MNKAGISPMDHAIPSKTPHRLFWGPGLSTKPSMKDMYKRNRNKNIFTQKHGRTKKYQFWNVNYIWNQWLHDPPTSTFKMANITIRSIYFSRLRKFSWMRGVAMSCNSRRPRGNSEQHQDFSCQFGKPESMSDEIQQKCQACCWKVKLC